MGGRFLSQLWIFNNLNECYSPTHLPYAHTPVTNLFPPSFLQRSHLWVCWCEDEDVKWNHSNTAVTARGDSAVREKLLK